jgi:hypothetical protein
LHSFTQTCCLITCLLHLPQADNAAQAAYEYQQQLEDHAAVLEAELDASKALHSQQQARMQQVTDELLRQVWGKVGPSL